MLIVIAPTGVALHAAEHASTMAWMGKVLGGTAWFAVLIAILSACAARPAGLTDAEWAFGTGPQGGRAIVGSAAEAFGFGLGRYSEEDPSGLYGDPAYVRSCRVASALWGLSEAEWAWCFVADNRERFLVPTVALFEMGEEERAGTESFGEAPGDDPAEYVTACRYAHQFGQADGVAAIDAPADHPFLALTDTEAAFCGEPENEALLARAADFLEIGPEPDQAELARINDDTRTCRIAYASR